MNKTLLCILFGFLYNSVVIAETLTLQQALDRAVKTDPRIEEKQQQVAAAHALELEAKNGDDLIYDVNIFVGLAPKKTGDFLTTDSNGNSISRSDANDHDGIAPWYNLRLSIIKPLYSFGKTEHYAQAATENTKLKKGDVSIEKTRIRIGVYQTYYKYLASKDARLLLEDVQSRLNKAINLVEKRLSEGSGNAKQSDVFELQTGAAMVSRYLIEAKGSEKNALDSMKVLTGIGLDNKLNFVEQRIVPTELPQTSLKTFKKRALKNRPEMRQLQAGLNAKKSLLKANKSKDKPNVYAAVVGSFAATPGRTDQNNPFVFDPFNHTTASPVVGFKWDWDSGKQPAQVKQAQADLDALISRSAFIRQNIPLQVAEQYQNVHTYHSIVEELAKGSRAGRRWMISSYADFEAGVGQAEKIMTAFQGYVLTHSDYLKAVNDYNMHVVKLKNVTGDHK